MNIAIINAVIAFSLFGITIIGIKDYMFAINAPPPVRVTAPTKRPLPTNIILEKIPIDTDQSTAVSCKSQFFTFKPRTAWNYTLTSDTINQDGKIAHTVSSIMAKLTAVSTGSATFAVISTNEKNPIYTTILCKTDGLYWNPVSLSGGSSEITGLLGMLNVKPILLIPSSEDSLHTNFSWRSILKADIHLGFLNQSIELPLVNTVISENTARKTVIIQSVADFTKNGLSFITNGSNLQFLYELQKNVGVIDVSLEAKISTFIDKKIKVKLR